MVHLDYRDSRPIYAQIVDGFREQITGGVLRPGEKLYEELLMDEEGLQDTANKLIHVGRPIDMDDEAFCRQLEVLEQACRHNSPDIRRCVADMVPTYHPKKD